MQEICARFWGGGGRLRAIKVSLRNQTGILIAPPSHSGADPAPADADNLYLDMNGIIHPCTHSDDGSVVRMTQEQMFLAVGNFVDKLSQPLSPHLDMHATSAALTRSLAPCSGHRQAPEDPLPRRRRVRPSRQDEPAAPAPLQSRQGALSGPTPVPASHPCPCLTPLSLPRTPA